MPSNLQRRRQFFAVAASCAPRRTAPCSKFGQGVPMPSGQSKVVVITGASAGVGRATALEFARRGARLGLIARGWDGLEAARRDVERLGGEAIVLPLDIADPERV